MASTECPRCAVLEREVETLKIALRSRDVIGQAKGLVMAATGCGPDDAFRILAEQSQHENRKVRDVAMDLIARRRPTRDAHLFDGPAHHRPKRRPGTPSATTSS